MAFVLAHYGNADAGLEALYLKRPVDQLYGRISRWDYVEEVFRTGGESTTTTPAPAPLLPGPAKVTRPTVLPFKKLPARDGETEHGGS